MGTKRIREKREGKKERQRTRVAKIGEKIHKREILEKEKRKTKR